MKKALIIGGSVIAAAALVYIGYKMYKKSKEAKMAPAATTNPLWNPNGTGGSVNPSAPVAPAPATTQNR